MKKRICIIHKVKMPDPRSFYKQGRSLANAGFETTIMGLFEKNEVVNGIRLMGFKPPKKRLSGFFLTNYKIFRSALKTKADIYHFHNLDFIPWGVLLRVVTGGKVIYDIHEAFPEYMLIKTYLPKTLRKIISFLVFIMEHGAARIFDAIVPNDNYVANGFRHRNKVVIFNFPTLDFFEKMDPVPYQNRKYDLFYHGSLPKYHVEVMMDIAQKFVSEKTAPKWGIVTNDQDTVAWAQQELRRRNLEEVFTFLPYTDYLNVFSYLRMARIGIIPLPPYKKFMKNIPLKMFEFMGCGLPIVLSDLPPSRQFIDGQACAVAVEPDNIDEYAKAIRMLLDNPEKAIAMGINGKKVVFEKYNWTSEEAKLLRLYNSLLGVKT